MKLFGPSESFDVERKRMVEEQLAEFPRSIIAAMAQVPRHEFIPPDKRKFAYDDCAVPIGYGQTISQPWIVAMMTTQLNPQPGARILEIGTGSGYQAAVLARLVAEVYSIEILKPLAQRAKETLQRIGGNNVHLRIGDGHNGWSEAAPFDGVIVTCAPESVPRPLVVQLKENGRMLVPVGLPGDQDLFVFQKYQGQLIELVRIPVRFVPMTGHS